MENIKIDGLDAWYRQMTSPRITFAFIKRFLRYYQKERFRPTLSVFYSSHSLKKDSNSSFFLQQQLVQRPMTNALKGVTT